jgi:hypothetical protein
MQRSDQCTADGRKADEVIAHSSVVNEGAVSPQSHHKHSSGTYQISVEVSHSNVKSHSRSQCRTRL